MSLVLFYRGQPPGRRPAQVPSRVAPTGIASRSTCCSTPAEPRPVATLARRMGLETDYPEADPAHALPPEGAHRAEPGIPFQRRLHAARRLWRGFRASRFPTSPPNASSGPSA
jgi:hypothetical protein